MLSKTVTTVVLTLAASAVASADISYMMTHKATGGSMAALAGSAAEHVSKYYLKGQKLMSSNGAIAIILDFSNQTVTTIDNTQKTYTVKKFADVSGSGGSADMTFDVKDTGQKKMVNGFNAGETLVTMTMDVETGRGPAMKMQAEMDVWISADAPGASEMHAFYQKNAANFPWSVMVAGGANRGIQNAITQMQRRLAEVNGIAVERIIRVKPAGGAPAPQMAQMPQMSPDQQAKMQAAMAKLQEMAKQGGPAAAAAQQAMANMGGMARGGAPAGGASAGNTLVELTEDASGFSTAGIPDSVFAIPEGYRLIP
jgi:hypothetical protein